MDYQKVNIALNIFSKRTRWHIFNRKKIILIISFLSVPKKCVYLTILTISNTERIYAVFQIIVLYVAKDKIKAQRSIGNTDQLL